MQAVSASVAQVWEGRCGPGNPCWDNRRGQIPWSAASLVLSIAGVSVGLSKQFVQGM